MPTGSARWDGELDRVELDDVASETYSIVDEDCECDGADKVLPNFIPYDSIYSTDEDHRLYFVPAFPATARITKVEKEEERSHHVLNPNIFTIEIKHGPCCWEVIRRYQDFSRLNRSIKWYRVKEKLRIVDREETARILKATGGSIPNEHECSTGAHGRKGHVCKLPHFPITPERLLSDDELEERRKELEDYLNAILHMPTYRNRKATAGFLDMSRLSFIRSIGLRHKEGFVKKCPGGRRVYQGCMRWCITNCAPWSERWLLVKDSFIAYLKPDDEGIHSVMLYDADFHVEHVTEDDRMIGTKHGIIITNLSRILQLRAHTEKQALEWTDAVKWVVRSHGKIWLEPHRFGSFAPIRTNCYAQWFADGSDMFTHAANMIELATQDIFITDWWLSPEIYLKRPAVKDQRWRLDKVLKRKAQQGIRIFVMLYKEVEIALNLKSIYSKTILEELHPNIKVIRHPDHDLETGVFFWAHHEKLLIIDQNIAFVGGIDLCFGRWDDYQHRLTDLGAVDVSDEPAPTSSSTQLKTLTVHQNVGFVPSPVPSAETELDKTVRLVKVQQKMSKWKQTARENSEIEKTTDQGRAYTQRMKSLDIDEHREKMLCMEREDMDDGTVKFWVGKDYVNFIFKDFVNLDQPFEDFIDRQTTPRMPWHDIGSVVYGEPARDAARHFIQRWNAAKGQKLKKDDNYPLLLPKSYDRVQVPKVFQDIPGTHKVNVQVLRSACDWSAGMNYKEHSIQNAYVDLISNAEHFIYIENQFFVSQIESNDVGNRICQALYDRIVKAYKNNETFRVYVMLPLLPAFEGQIGTGQSSALQVVLHWAYMSISKGDNSLLVRLKRIMDNPLNYICFCGLRSFDELNGKLVTELVYIHAKLMIVDDKRCIIGSANINDRSQKGDGDSEVCVCVEDVDFDPGVFNSKPYPSGKFCGSLRKHLFQEHLGIFIQPDEEIDVRDPISDHFYFHTWLKIAASNTRIFEKVFNCIPTDSVQSFDDLAEYRAITPLADTDVDTAEAELEEVKGFLVIFPTTFLHYSDLSPSIMSKEGLMPIEVFV